MRLSRSILVVLASTMLASSPAHATFHLMQVEQVIGGVNGDPNLQAIQLRTRTTFQNFVMGGQLVAYDATGSNPVVLCAPSPNLPSVPAGAQILLATSGFAAILTPNVTPNYTLTNKIPPSYLAAGSLTWEDKLEGGVLWRVTWGGASYTGLTNGLIDNDADGEFAPVIAGPLPSTGLGALRYNFGAAALSTNNADDYAVTGGAAVFTNTLGVSGTVTAPLSVGPDASRGSLALVAPAPNPVTGSMSYAVVVPRETQVEVLIHDVSGRAIHSLVNLTLQAGRHSFSWAAPAAAAMPNGIYFLELNAQGVRQTRRFALLR